MYFSDQSELFPFMTGRDHLKLDEVMNGLDPQNVALISKVLVNLKEKQKLIIMASHLLSNLQAYADRVLFLKDGAINKDFDNKNPDKQYLKVRKN